MRLSLFLLAFLFFVSVSFADPPSVSTIPAVLAAHKAQYAGDHISGATWYISSFGSYSSDTRGTRNYVSVLMRFEYMDGSPSGGVHEFGNFDYGSISDFYGVVSSPYFNYSRCSADSAHSQLLQDMTNISVASQSASGSGLMSSAIGNPSVPPDFVSSLASRINSADPASLTSAIAAQNTGSNNIYTPALGQLLFGSTVSASFPSLSPADRDKFMSFISADLVQTGGQSYSNILPSGSVSFSATDPTTGTCTLTYTAPVVDGQTVGSNVNATYQVAPASTGGTGGTGDTGGTGGTGDTGGTGGTGDTGGTGGTGDTGGTSQNINVTVDNSGVISAVNGLRGDVSALSNDLKADPTASLISPVKPNITDSSALNGGLFSQLRNVGSQSISRAISISTPGGGMTTPVNFGSSLSDTPLVGSLWETFRIMIRCIFGIIFFLRFCALTWLALQ